VCFKNVLWPKTKAYLRRRRRRHHRR